MPLSEKELVSSPQKAANWSEVGTLGLKPRNIKLVRLSIVRVFGTGGYLI